MGTNKVSPNIVRTKRKGT